MDLQSTPQYTVKRSSGVTYCVDAIDRLHRADESGHQDGPAWIGVKGTQRWYINGLCHRLDGPAVIWKDGTQLWFLDGHAVTQEQWAADPRVIEFHAQTPVRSEGWLKRL